MEIALVVFVLYACSVLIWCSLNDEWTKAMLISPTLLQDWRESRSDMIVFELHPEGTFSTTGCVEDEFLSVTPSGLQALMAWIPSGSTVVLCNHGVSSRSVRKIQQLLIFQNISRIYWVDEVTQATRGASTKWP